MAENGGVCQSGCILFGGSSGGCHTGFRSTSKREGTLDRKSGWFCYTSNSSFSYNWFHKLEKAGYLSITLLNILEIFLSFPT